MVELNKLRSVSELKGVITKALTPAQILELASKKLIPHYVLTNPATGEESTWFTAGELDDWFRGYFVKYNGIHNTEITVVNFDGFGLRVMPSDIIPPQLVLIKSLYKLPFVKINTPPGVYFLCKGDELLYIGKANNVGNRILEHRREMKIIFDTVYFICAHIDHLLHIESALIRHFKPKYNIQCASGECDEREHIIIKSFLKQSP